VLNKVLVEEISSTSIIKGVNIMIKNKMELLISTINQTIINIIGEVIDVVEVECCILINFKKITIIRDEENKNGKNKNYF
jgi:hypothetical protein